MICSIVCRYLFLEACNLAQSWVTMEQLAGPCSLFGEALRLIKNPNPNGGARAQRPFPSRRCCQYEVDLVNSLMLDLDPRQDPKCRTPQFWIHICMYVHIYIYMVPCRRVDSPPPNGMVPPPNPKP